MTLINLKRISGRIDTGGKLVDLLDTLPNYLRHPYLPNLEVTLSRETYRFPLILPGSTKSTTIEFGYLTIINLKRIFYPDLPLLLRYRLLLVLPLLSSLRRNFFISLEFLHPQRGLVPIHFSSWQVTGIW